MWCDKRIQKWNQISISIKENKTERMKEYGIQYSSAHNHEGESSWKTQFHYLWIWIQGISRSTYIDSMYIESTRPQQRPNLFQSDLPSLTNLFYFKNPHFSKGCWAIRASYWMSSNSIATSLAEDWQNKLFHFSINSPCLQNPRKFGLILPRAVIWQLHCMLLPKRRENSTAEGDQLLSPA